MSLRIFRHRHHPSPVSYTHLLEKSDAKRDEQYGKILDKLNDMQADINKALLSIAEFKEKSGNRWDTIVDRCV